MEMCRNNENEIEESIYEYECEIITTKLFIKQNEPVDVYGLRLFNKDEKRLYDEDECCTIEDISENFEIVSQLKQLIDELGVFPPQLYEVVEDYLAVHMC